MAAGTEQIVVVGLGYVGLPLAVSLARFFPTIGFDIDRSLIENCRHHLRRYEALPDQAIKFQFFRLEILRE